METPATTSSSATRYAQLAETGNSVVRWSLQRRFWLLGFAIVAIGGYLAFARSAKTPGLSAEAAPAPARPSIPVAAVTARLGDLKHYLTAIGTVTPFNTVTVKSRVDGELVKVAFHEGQLVKEGDLLAEIDPRPFQVQLEQAQGQLARDQASLTNAKILLARDQSLFQQGVIARQDLDNQQSLADQFKGAIASDQGTVDNARLQLTYSKVTAPISGRIGLRLVDQGNIVHAADATGLVVIAQVQPISVRFSIPEDDLPQVLKDMSGGAQLPVDGYDRDFQHKLATGYLATLDNEIDQTTGTIRLKAIFPNTDGVLFPNQFVNAKLLVDTRRATVLIPAAAVQRGSNQGSYVYVVGPDAAVQKRIVKVGATEGDTVAIDSGLKPGEVVVVDGVDKLRPGAKVTVQMAANTAGDGSPQ